jgi:predicted TIM-barrel enzyme
VEPTLRPLYFGGVAFKHRAHIPDERLGAVAAEAAASGVDVVTTSGTQTGTPPTVEKIRRMWEGLASDRIAAAVPAYLARKVVTRHPLAVASGITPKNVRPFLPYVDAFLVASGIESKFGVFDPARVRALADIIHEGT